MGGFSIPKRQLLVHDKFLSPGRQFRLDSTKLGIGLFVQEVNGCSKHGAEVGEVLGFAVDRGADSGRAHALYLNGADEGCRFVHDSFILSVL
jgi:hypothetical protein